MKRELDNGKEEQRRKVRQRNINFCHASCTQFFQSALSVMLQSRVLRQSMNISSRMIKMEVLHPLVKILGEDARALRAKVTALRNTAVKGLKSYGATLQQVLA